MPFIVNPGDQIVFIRRRISESKKVNEDDGTEKLVKVNDDTEFGAVNAGDHLEIEAGEAGVEWDEDKRYFIVKWRCR